MLEFVQGPQQITQEAQDSGPSALLTKYSPLSPGLPYGGALTTDALKRETAPGRAGGADRRQLRAVRTLWRAVAIRGVMQRGERTSASSQERSLFDELVRAAEGVSPAPQCGLVAKR